MSVQRQKLRMRNRLVLIGAAPRGTPENRCMKIARRHSIVVDQLIFRPCSDNFRYQTIFTVSIFDPGFSVLFFPTWGTLFEK